MNKLLLNRMKFIKSFFIQQFALLISVIYIVVGFFGRFYCCSGGSHFIQLTFHNNFTIIYQYNKTNKLPSIGKLWQLTHYATYYNTCTGCICNSIALVAIAFQFSIGKILLSIITSDLVIVIYVVLNERSVLDI